MTPPVATPKKRIYCLCCGRFISHDRPLFDHDLSVHAAFIGTSQQYRCLSCLIAFETKADYLTHSLETHNRAACQSCMLVMDCGWLAVHHEFECPQRRRHCPLPGCCTRRVPAFAYHDASRLFEHHHCRSVSRCRSCWKSFMTPYSLQAHIDEVHSSSSSSPLGGGHFSTLNSPYRPPPSPFSPPPGENSF
jgi:hypothetical protein